MMSFPRNSYKSCGDYGLDYFSELRAGAATIDHAALDSAAELLDKTIVNGNRIYACGNGGSAAIANHLTCDCLKGIRADTSIKPAVFSLSATVELITAIANDISYEQVFSYQLESLGKQDDLLIAISSSGNSPNILRALEKARALGMKSISFTGFSGGEAAKMADISLWVNAHNYGVVEDLHQSLMHLLAQFIRQRHFIDPSQIANRKF